jgi:predicted peroxiredoxin
MKLAILVNTNRHLAQIIGLTKAAVARGHEVVLFNMDEGTKLLTTAEFTELCNTKGVLMSFCDHSAKRINLSTGLPEEIVVGSQYNNAVMMHDADRVIVL